MNEIVRTVKAGTLPEELRQGFDPEATVEVTVRSGAVEAEAAASESPADAAEDRDSHSAAGRIDIRALRDPSRPKPTWAQVRAGIERYQARLAADPSLIERDPVGRVRAARYGEE